MQPAKEAQKLTRVRADGDEEVADEARLVSLRHTQAGLVQSSNSTLEAWENQRLGPKETQKANI